MLVLSRRIGEKLLIGDAVLWVDRVAGGVCRIVIDAPKEIKVLREELTLQPRPSYNEEHDARTH